MRFYITLLFTLLLSLYSFSQNKDSVKVVSLFNELLTVPSKADEASVQLAKIKSQNKNNKPILSTYYYELAKYLLYIGSIDSSIVISNKGVALFDSSETSFELVKFLNVSASAYSFQKKYKKGIKLYEQSLKVSEINNELHQAAYIKNNIANLFISMLDYQSAYNYVSEAYEFLKATPNDPYLSSITSILSVTELKLGRLDEAKLHGLEALELAEKKKNISALIVANYSLGEIELNGKNLELSEAYFLSSLELSEKYRQSHYLLLNNIGLMNLNIEKEQFDKAILYGETALYLATQQGNLNTEYSIKKHLAHAYAGTGHYKKAFDLMNSSHLLFLESNGKETQEAINDILVKYDTEKKEKEIATNRLLILENEVKSSRLVYGLVVLGLVLIAVVVVLFSVRSKNKNRVKRLKTEKEREVLSAILQGEELERERLASELHDGLASVLTAAKYKVETLGSSDENEKKEVLSVLSDAQVETRRIAHNLAPLNLLKKGLFGALQSFTLESSNTKTTVTFNANKPNVNLSKEKEVLTYRVAQELVQNALKHAFASQIDVQLMIDDTEVRLIVEDDGVGFDTTLGSQSNGLQSISYRAEKSGGFFEVNSTINGAGTVALFSLPLD